MTSVGRFGGRDELERMLLSESASVAHFAMMLAALSYSMFESFLSAPALPMWSVVSFGFMTWFTSRALLMRRYA